MKSLTLLFSIATILFVSCDNVVYVDEKKTFELDEEDLSGTKDYKEIENCEEGRELARKDIEAGELRYIFGTVGTQLGNADKLEEMFNIEVIRMEGIFGVPTSCYNQVMYEEIQRKYGQDAFNRALE